LEIDHPWQLLCVVLGGRAGVGGCVVFAHTAGEELDVAGGGIGIVLGNGEEVFGYSELT